MSQVQGKAELLSGHTREEIDHWVAKFPPGRQRSAVLSALRAVQEQNHGFLTPELMDAVAEYLKLPPIQVYEVASFYSMFETHPCGRHHVSICTNISCMLNGGEELVAHAEKRLGIKLNESTADGRIFLKREEECLAACTTPDSTCGYSVYSPEPCPSPWNFLKVDIRRNHAGSGAIRSAQCGRPPLNTVRGVILTDHSLGLKAVLACP